jgi:hypothetical protein
MATVTVQELLTKRESILKSINSPNTSADMRARLNTALSNLETQLVAAGGTVPGSAPAVSAPLPAPAASTPKPPKASTPKPPKASTPKFDYEGFLEDHRGYVKQGLSLNEIGEIHEQTAGFLGTHKNSKYKRVVHVGTDSKNTGKFTLKYSYDNKVQYDAQNRGVLEVMNYLVKIYEPGKKTPPVKPETPKPETPKPETPKPEAKGPKAKAPKPEPRVYKWEGYDVEQCEAYIKKRNLEKRVAKLEAFKEAALKSGADPEVVAKMTFKDMVVKKSVHQQAVERAGGMVSIQVGNHVKKAELKVDKGDTDKLRNFREKLEKDAAERVAVFSREAAKAVAEQVKEYAEKLRKEEEKK